VGFVDPSGGSSDSFAAAIAHKEGDKLVLDAVREIRPPFSPEAATAELAGFFRRYGVSTIRGDRYAGMWPREAFERHGVRYDTADRDRSALYLELLPAIMSQRASLIDNPRLVAQLASLERRTAVFGRDRIDHPPNAHDDLANTVAGAFSLLSASTGADAWIAHYRGMLQRAQLALPAASGPAPKGDPLPWRSGSPSRPAAGNELTRRYFEVRSEFSRLFDDSPSVCGRCGGEIAEGSPKRGDGLESWHLGCCPN
jgi:hypothetical protein